MGMKVYFVLFVSLQFVELISTCRSVVTLILTLTKVPSTRIDIYMILYSVTLIIGVSMFYSRK